MAKLDNLAKSDLKDIWKAIRDLRHATPLNRASIGRGGLRVHSGGVITIENGGLKVTGTAEIIGKLIASGTIEFNGPVKITGPLDISGLTRIMGDLILASGGKFTAGSIELNPDGSAKFGTMTIDPTGKITSGLFELNPDGSAKFGDLTIDADGTINSGSATINPDGSATFGQFDIAENGDLESKGALSIEGPTALKNDLTVDQLRRIILGGLVLENQGAGNASMQMPGGGISASQALGMSIVHDSINIGAQGTLTLNGAAIKMAGIQLKADATPNLHMDGNGQLWRTP